MNSEFKLLIIFLFCLFLPCFALGQDKHDGRNEIICGPRCLKYACSYFQIDVSLIDLVREIQWPEIEQGASLAKMQEALENRGIHTSLLNLPSGQHLQANSLVIVHMKGGNDEESTRLGHYVVWKPDSNEDTVHYWDGLDGTFSVPAKYFYSKASGLVLLVSSEPIQSPLEVVNSVGSSLTYSWWVLPGCAFVLLLGVVWNGSEKPRAKFLERCQQ